MILASVLGLMNSKCEICFIINYKPMVIGNVEVIQEIMRSSECQISGHLGRLIYLGRNRIWAGPGLVSPGYVSGHAWGTSG